MTLPVADKSLILVVDDTPSNIHVLVDALSQDYDLMVATGGVQALELASQSPQPDLILLDMMMPGMDGHEVCRRLKEDDATRNIPVIFITADTTRDMEQKSFAMGAVDYVTKPFFIPVVRARVHTHLTLKQRTDLLEKLANLDGLTGIANRRQFDALLEMEWNRCARQESPLSVIILDVDHFKTYNDTYGHSAGDSCLRGLASLLKKATTRPGDLAARYGGEEFAVLLPFTSFDGAEIIAGRIRQSVADWPVGSGDSATLCPITISAGFATVLPLFEGSPSTLIQAADEMLYQAKRNGRNRIAGVNVNKEKL